MDIYYSEQLINSSTKSIEYGVPQRSILQSLIFTLFMNDFFQDISITFFYTFC